MIVWIWGAGLLGRGFLAPCWSGNRIRFIEKDFGLYQKLLRQHRYTIYFGHRFEVVEPVAVSRPPELDHLDELPDLICTAVGPESLPEVGRWIATHLDVPVLTFENDPQAARMLNRLGIKAYQGIAEVSVPYSSGELGDWDSLGVLGDRYGIIRIPIDFAEQHPDLMPRPIGTYAKNVFSDPERAWAEKFRVHLAPHSLLAYLGISRKLEHIHQVLTGWERDIDAAVEPLLEDAETKWPTGGWKRLWSREKNRLTQAHLKDSVWRVGRRPWIKAASEERLHLGIKLALGKGGSTELWEEALTAALSFCPEPEKALVTLGLPDDCMVNILSQISSYEPPYWAENLYEWPKF